MGYFLIANTANADTASIPTHRKGDLLVIGFWRSGGPLNTADVPSGWQSQVTSFSTGALVLAHRVAQSSSESSFSVNNAQQCIAAVYRGAILLQPWRNIGSGATTSGTGSFGALSVATPLCNQTSIGAIGISDGTITFPSSSTLYDRVAEIQNGSTGRFAMYEYNNPNNAGIATDTLTLSGSGAWRSAGVSVLTTVHDSDYDGGGSPRPSNPFLQQVIG